MAMSLYNLARMTTATTGTGTITLGSAVSGFLTFAQAGVADGTVVSYGIRDGANSEVGTGTYTSAGTTLTRTVTKSTNSDVAISLSGSAEVFITMRAEDLQQAVTITPAVNGVALTIANATHTSAGIKSISMTQTVNGAVAAGPLIFGNLIPGATPPAVTTLLQQYQYNTADVLSLDTLGQLKIPGRSNSASIFLGVGSTSTGGLWFQNTSQTVGMQEVTAGMLSSYANGQHVMAVNATGGVVFTVTVRGDVGGFAWANGTAPTGTRDTFLVRPAAATIQQGSFDAAAPVAQTQQVQSVVGGTTDTAGAAWTRSGSKGTGTGGGGNVVEKTAFAAKSTGSTQNTFVERNIIVAKGKVLTDASAVSLFEVALPTLTMAGGIIRANVVCTDGTDMQSFSQVVTWSAVNKGGAYTTAITVDTANDAKSVSAGTIANTWSILNGTNKVTIQLSSDTSLTPSTNAFICYYTVENHSEQAITIL